MAPKLYTTAASGNCYKVRLLASLLDIDLDHEEVDFFNRQHKSPEYLAVNPRGSVPALVDGDRVFTDSAAIAVYLAGTYAVDKGYWPTDVVEQAAVVDWLAFSASWIHFGISRARAILSFSWPADASDETLADAQTRGRDSLDILEQRLSSHDWVALDDRPTVADLSIFVYVGLAHMGDISLDPFPAVKAWIARIQGLPGFLPPTGLDVALAPRKKT